MAFSEPHRTVLGAVFFPHVVLCLSFPAYITKSVLHSNILVVLRVSHIHLCQVCLHSTPLRLSWLGPLCSLPTSPQVVAVLHPSPHHLPDKPFLNNMAWGGFCYSPPEITHSLPLTIFDELGKVCGLGANKQLFYFEV